MQETSFRGIYDSIQEDEIQEEVYILENIRLSTDFYEYILTDPAKYLAIIHYKDLEDKFKIYVSFATETGNMTIVYMFNDNVYCSSSVLDVTGNDRIMKTFTEQVQDMLDEYKQLMINRENDRIKKIEEHIHNNSIRWYDLYKKQEEQPKIVNSDKCYHCVTMCMIGLLCGMVLAGIKMYVS